MDKENEGVKCTLNKKWKRIGGNFICTFTQNTTMFEINFFPIYGAMIGFNYWNENFSDKENQHDDVQHMVQIMILIFGISFIWYEDKGEMDGI